MLLVLLLLPSPGLELEPLLLQLRQLALSRIQAAHTPRQLLQTQRWQRKNMLILHYVLGAWQQQQHVAAAATMQTRRQHACRLQGATHL